MCIRDSSLSSIRIPDIHYTLDDLEKKSKDYILILGIPELDGKKLYIANFRNRSGRRHRRGRRALQPESTSQDRSRRERQCDGSAVSYTHLDVYKRQEL